MKHVTYGEKSMLMGDAAANMLLEYARLLADASAADSVTLSVISPDGNTSEASFLLTPSTVLMVESTNSEVQPPDNSDAVGEIQGRVDALLRPAFAVMEEPWEDRNGEFTEAL